MSIYRQFGVEAIINAAGPLTRLGGSSMPDAVVEAMRQASRESVPIEQMQAAASRVISRVTKAEAGLVTSGASAGLTLGTAAILAGNNRRRIEQLPDVTGIPCEFLIARDQRNGYDHAVRAAGAKLVDVGMNEVVAGSGIRPIEIADYELAVTEQTVGVLYVYRDFAEPSLEEVVEWAKGRGLRVLVDAAAELPPGSNLKVIPGTGADLVVFSGGKAIRGPQATGILCGRRELIESAAMQMLDMDEAYGLWDPPTDFIDKERWPSLPRQGIGRGFKVGKEQIVGLLVALELVVNQEADTHALLQQKTARLRKTFDEWGLRTLLPLGHESSAAGQLAVSVGDKCSGGAVKIARQLRAGSPPVFVRADLSDNKTIHLHLATVREDQERSLLEALRKVLAAEISD